MIAQSVLRIHSAMSSLQQSIRVRQTTGETLEIVLVNEHVRSWK
jgi:hypothetical protein